MSHTASSAQPRFLTGLCLGPAVAVFSAFWLLPMAQLFLLPAQSDSYMQVLTHGRYWQSLFNTVWLSAVVTLLTLLLGAAVGLYLARRRFMGRQLLLSLLTVPLSFPGVIIGFFVILIGGRQGPYADLTQLMGLGRVTFAYGWLGLLLAYLYFSLPRAVASYTAAAQAMDSSLEEAATILGASPWHIARDVWLPQLWPITVSCGAIVFATSMGAFGTAFTLSSKFEVLPISIYNEFTNYANFGVAAALSIGLGLITWVVLLLARLCSPSGRGGR